jgi:hypothetical protein
MYYNCKKVFKCLDVNKKGSFSKQDFIEVLNHLYSFTNKIKLIKVQIQNNKRN